ncbi:hypothetical protein CEXT_757731 [Caerostris extrusa]|uniref:Uncharacterized protein n=1 Tax=Caerostris extrusa TaxID=172846 RepID=A0AAV4P9D6_CAEEX|nr:hypothetical protein CEXT_757731 [Caerostris extrusa]
MSVSQPEDLKQLSFEDSYKVFGLNFGQGVSLIPRLRAPQTNTQRLLDLSTSFNNFPISYNVLIHGFKYANFAQVLFWAFVYNIRKILLFFPGSPRKEKQNFFPSNLFEYLKKTDSTLNTSMKYLKTSCWLSPSQTELIWKLKPLRSSLIRTAKSSRPFQFLSQRYTNLQPLPIPQRRGAGDKNTDVNLHA